MLRNQQVKHNHFENITFLILTIIITLSSFCQIALEMSINLKRNNLFNLTFNDDLCFMIYVVVLVFVVVLVVVKVLLTEPFEGLL